MWSFKWRNEFYTSFAKSSVTIESHPLFPLNSVGKPFCSLRLLIFARFSNFTLNEAMQSYLISSF